MKKYKCPKCGNVVEPDAASAEVFCYNPDCGIMLDANRYV
jgi:DNA-directed RNA polymerase subunit RPC12/RpoP